MYGSMELYLIVCLNTKVVLGDDGEPPYETSVTSRAVATAYTLF